MKEGRSGERKKKKRAKPFRFLLYLSFFIVFLSMPVGIAYPGTNAGELNGTMIGINTAMLHGLKVRDITPELTREFDIPERLIGVVIVAIEENSAAATELCPGDVIQQVDGKIITSAEDLGRMLSALKPAQQVALLIHRQRQNCDCMPLEKETWDLKHEEPVSDR
jgi:membrane-associated protease RseP (regulator of RpoE activity)